MGEWGVRGDGAVREGGVVEVESGGGGDMEMVGIDGEAV